MIKKTKEDLVDKREVRCLQLVKPAYFKFPKKNDAKLLALYILPSVLTLRQV